MSLTSLEQTLQLAAWFFTLIQIIAGLYVLVLNPTGSRNRHILFFFFIFGLMSYAQGAMIGAENVVEARQSSILLASTSLAIQPVFLLMAITLVKPQVWKGRGRFLEGLVLLLAATPALLTALDLIWGTGFWFTGLKAGSYAGGLADLPQFVAGRFSKFLTAGSFGFIAPLSHLFLLYTALFDKTQSARNRKLAWLLFAVQTVTVFFNAAGLSFIDVTSRVIGSTAVYTIGVGFASLSQLASEGQPRRGKLSVRLTALVLVIAIPLIVAVMVFVTSRAEKLLVRNALDSLRTTNRSLQASANLWVDLNVKALSSLVHQPDIQSMDPARQTPVITAMADAFPQMYLVSTLNLDGMNIARSDDLPEQDYGNQRWFQDIASGSRLSYQTLIEPTNARPTLVVAMPILNSAGRKVGVGMFAADLATLSGQIKLFATDRISIAYLVDANNRVVAHSEGSGNSAISQMSDLSDYAPVAQLRTGQRGAIRFTDAGGQTWRAHIDVLGNGWGVIVQLPERDLLAPVQAFTQVAWIIVAIGAALLLGMVTITLRQSLRPVSELTDTARAIAAGDLNRVAPAGDDDELGLLARAFNSMTSQLRDLVSSLEQRVGIRTQDLERRAIQLQVTAEVAREAASIRELEVLLEKAVDLISSRFDFYHAGIFLLDPAGEFAILRAASSEGGKRMLERGHKLRVGQVGIVGHVVATGEARIALDVGSDAVYFNNPELPETHSEAGLPLLVGDHVTGVLDVQSTRSSAFTHEDISILQIMADQIALAIENARLLSESQRAVRELETLYQQQVRTTWRKQLAGKTHTYAYSQAGVAPASGSLEPGTADGSFQIRLPIELRGQRLGWLALRREPELGPWRAEEIELARETLAHIALALENARLIEEVRRRAHQEQVVGQIAAQAQASLNLDTVMQSAVREIGRALGAQKVQIRLDGRDGSR